MVEHNKQKWLQNASNGNMNGVIQSFRFAWLKYESVHIYKKSRGTISWLAMRSSGNDLALRGENRMSAMIERNMQVEDNSPHSFCLFSIRCHAHCTMYMISLFSSMLSCCIVIHV